jgi:hypothetical protein
MTATPQIAQSVWYYPREGERHLKGELTDQPFAAIVTHVAGDRTVNLMVITPSGNPYAVTGVTLAQEGDTPPADLRYCEYPLSPEAQQARADAKAKAAEAKKHEQDKVDAARPLNAREAAETARRKDYDLVPAADRSDAERAAEKKRRADIDAAFTAEKAGHPDAAPLPRHPLLG